MIGGWETLLGPECYYGNYHQNKPAVGFATLSRKNKIIDGEPSCRYVWFTINRMELNTKLLFVLKHLFCMW